MAVIRPDGTIETGEIVRASGQIEQVTGGGGGPSGDLFIKIAGEGGLAGKGGLAGNGGLAG